MSSANSKMCLNLQYNIKFTKIINFNKIKYFKGADKMIRCLKERMKCSSPDADSIKLNSKLKIVVGKCSVIRLIFFLYQVFKQYSLYFS